MVPKEEDKKIIREEVLKEEWKKNVFLRDHFHNVNSIILEQLIKASQKIGAFPENYQGIDAALNNLKNVKRENSASLLEKTAVDKDFSSSVSKQGLFGGQQKETKVVEEQLSEVTVKSKKTTK